MVQQEGGWLVGEGSDTEVSPELAQDINELQERLGDALGLYYELRDKHGELPGWEMVEAKHEPGHKLG